MKRTKRGAFALLLALCVTLGLLLALTPAASASSAAETYGLYVGGVQITSDNLTVNGSSGTAAYDPAKRTLTLNNYSYTGSGTNINGKGGGIDYRGNGNLEIVLKGRNSIVKSGDSSPGESYGIYFEVDSGTLTISGDGSLDISFEDTSSGISKRNGIFCEPGAFVMESGTVTAAGGYAEESVGIYANDGITFNGGTFTGIGKPTTEYESRGIYTYAAITINGGTVTAQATNSDTKEAYAFQGDVTVNGGEVTASASSKIFDGSISIGAGATVEAGTDASGTGATVVTDVANNTSYKYAKITFAAVPLDPVSYLDWDATNKELVEKTGDNACKDYALVTASDTAWGAANETKWYVVNSDVTIASRITVTGDVRLILADGFTLTASAGITVTGSNKLTIYAQSEGAATMGKLSATGGNNAAGIGGGDGGAGGTITVNGGAVTATGGKFAAGIGGGESGAGGTITVNGGAVTANGGANGAGIGGGNGGDGGAIAVNGGAVTATGGTGGAGIGGGTSGAGGAITINGGEVTANSGKFAAGIGGGYSGASGAISITGGTVNANGNVGGTSNDGGAGIGGGENGKNSGDGNSISITGGTVTATVSAGVGAAIGNGGGSGTDVTVTISADLKVKAGASVDGTGAAVVTDVANTTSYKYARVYTPRDPAVSYLDWDATNKKLVEKTGNDACDDYTLVTESDAAWNTGWYVADGEVTISNRVTVSGDVHLILKDSAELTASAGITVTGDNSLTIYAQSTGAATMGKLSATGGDRAAGIGGGDGQSGGAITVNGGAVTANGNSGGAGIGGGNGGAGGTITISGGTVTATGGENGAGIGDGKDAAASGTISLSWTDKDNDSITASSYGGTVTFEKYFAIEGETAVLTADTISTANGKKIVPYELPPVSYQDAAWNAETKTVDFTEKTCDDYTPVTSDLTAWDGGTDGAWYVVNSDVTIAGRVTVTGTVNLILCDGVTLNASKGITVQNENQLTVYAQSGGTGKLIATGTSSGDEAGIGAYRSRNGSSNCGTVTIKGGVIEARGGNGGNKGAGIGGAGENSGGGNITIYGGSVTAVGQGMTTGIGSAWSPYDNLTYGSTSVTIYGGEINATGGQRAAGIGGGTSASGITVEIYGGIIKATGGSQNSAGIGYGDGSSGKHIIVAIHGGDVTASGTIAIGAHSTNEEITALTVSDALTVKAGDAVASAVKVATSDFVASPTQKYAHIFTAHTHEDDDIAFEPWHASDNLPTVAGDYALMKDVTLSSTWNVPSGETNLCLNGHGITETASGAFVLIDNGAVLNLYDCGTTTHYFNLADNGKAVNVNSESGAQSFTGGYLTGGNGGYNNGDGASWGEGGAVCVWNGTFTMNGGTILGNTAGHGAVLVHNGTFTLNEGKICYNSGNEGSGVSLRCGNGTFVMNGGELSNNVQSAGGVSTVDGNGTARIDLNGGVIRDNAGWGIDISGSSPTLSITGNFEITGNANGGIWTGGAGDIRLWGTPKIQGNYYVQDGVNVPRNVYVFDSKPIIITDALTSGADIGVTMQTPGVFTSGLSGKGTETNFTSDNADYGVKLNSDGEAALMAFSTLDTAPAAVENLTYNGAEQELVTAGVATGGSVQYKLGDTGAYSETIPTATDAGTHTVYYKVVGDDTHADTKEASVSVTIAPASEPFEITLSQDSYVYDGTAKKPSVTVKKGNLTVPANEYTVTYANNTNVGTATVTLSDVDGGNYAVSGSASFTISAAGTPFDITLSQNSYAYDGTAKEPSVTVKKDGATVPSGEYTVSYANNTNVGTATVTLSDVDGGNYAVSGSATFTIIVIQLENIRQ